jgi:hypothetical protein
MILRSIENFLFYTIELVTRVWYLLLCNKYIMSIQWCISWCYYQYKSPNYIAWSPWLFLLKMLTVFSYTHCYILTDIVVFNLMDLHWRFYTRDIKVKVLSTSGTKHITYKTYIIFKIRNTFVYFKKFRLS